MLPIPKQHKPRTVQPREGQGHNTGTPQSGMPATRGGGRNHRASKSSSTDPPRPNTALLSLVQLSAALSCAANREARSSHAMRACLILGTLIAAARGWLDGKDRMLATAQQLSSAQQWLSQWQAQHIGTPQYRAAASDAAGLPTSRIPRLVVVTVGSVTEALASRWRDNFATFWTLSPEYAHLIFEDADCESFLAACCPPEEGLAFRLVKSGTQKNNVFLISWLREIGGIVVDQDTALVRPLSTAIPPSASVVTGWAHCTRSRSIGCFEYGVLFAYEPGNPIWHYMSRIVIRNVLAQADFACRHSARGCRGSYGCVVAMTAMGPYALALEELLEQYHCKAPVQPCSDKRQAECAARFIEGVRRARGPHNDAICAGATHDSLRRLVVLTKNEYPTSHSICHAKAGAKKQCARPNETKTHYISNPAAGVKYYLTPEGRIDGSSAPNYYQPRCSNTSAPRRWSACDQARSHVAGNREEMAQLETVCSADLEARAADREARAQLPPEEPLPRSDQPRRQRSAVAAASRAKDPSRRPMQRQATATKERATGKAKGANSKVERPSASSGSRKSQEVT